MTIKRVYEVVKVIDMLNHLKGKQGSWQIADIQFFMKCSRSTTERALRNGVAMGCLNVTWFTYHGKPARRFELDILSPMLDTTAF